MPLILTIDVGNSNVSIGIFENSNLAHTWRASTNPARTVDELGLLLQSLFQTAQVPSEEVRGVAISSVVPPVGTNYARTCRKYLHVEPLVVGPGIKTGLPMHCDNPKDIGADRVVNSVAALHRYGPPLIVAKMGTATTLCVIDDTGAYIGGIIAPGMTTAVNALANRAAKLPQIDFTYPPQVIGKNTLHSMQSGALFGTVSLLDGLVRRIRRELPLPYTVVATGGLVELIAPHSETVQHVVPNLSLEGLQLLWTRNYGDNLATSEL